MKPSELFRDKFPTFDIFEKEALELQSKLDEFIRQQNNDIRVVGAVLYNMLEAIDNFLEESNKK